MILTDEILQEAFDFRKAELWNLLDNTDLFAFRLSDGEIGYCVVLGYNEDQYMLNLYRGRKGLTSYFKTFVDNDAYYAYQDFINMYDQHFLSCNFVQAAGLKEQTKRRIRSYAKKNGRSICRDKGWPDFTTVKPGRMLIGLHNEEDVSDMTEALRVANWVARLLETTDYAAVGFNDCNDYPDRDGGLPVPFFEPDGQGGYTLGTTILPACLPMEYVAPEYKNAILTNQVTRLPEKEEWMLKLIHLSLLETNEMDDSGSFVTMLVGFSRNCEVPFYIMSKCCWIEQPTEILNSVARQFITKGYRPPCIFVSDDYTYHLLKDFCDKCCITLDKVEEIEELDELANFTFNNLG